MKIEIDVSEEIGKKLISVATLKEKETSKVILDWILAALETYRD